jgi:hypothetical protein
MPRGKKLLCFNEKEAKNLFWGALIAEKKFVFRNMIAKQKLVCVCILGSLGVFRIC